jgi:hypothetical protein
MKEARKSERRAIRLQRRYIQGTVIICGVTDNVVRDVCAEKAISAKRVHKKREN